MSSSPILTIEGLSFSYGRELILQNISFSLEAGSSISLVGPSGFGKTTLLQLIAGDLTPTAGTITKQGLWRRVFQQNGLLPWLTVEENIRLGLRGVSPERVLDFKQLTQLLDLSHVLSFYPRELSGGQKQRTEIARALIGRPDGLLLDEPFSSLDYFIRIETKNYLKRILNDYPITLILVTHDIPEAVELTQKTYALNGRPAQIIRSYENNSQDDLVTKIWNDLK